MATLESYPVGQKFCRNCSISHGFRDISNFCEKFENSKWPPFLARQNFFENLDGYPAVLPRGSKVSPKLLYLAQFSRYKYFCVLPFLAKNSKMAAMFGKTNIFGKMCSLICRDTLWVKNFVKIALPSTVFEI